MDGRIGVLLHPPHREPDLVFRQPPTLHCLRKVGQQKHRAHGDEYRERALDIEEPAPGRAAEHAVHVVEDRRCDERAERVADDVAAEEESGARAKLCVLVPFADEEERAGEERGFDDAEGEASEEDIIEASTWLEKSHLTG